MEITTQILENLLVACPMRPRGGFFKEKIQKKK
jgi:hypothetical protein